MAEKHLVNVNMPAVGRVAGRVNLTNIRLIGITAKSAPIKGDFLEPEVDQSHEALRWDGGAIEVRSTYRFTVRSAGDQVAEAEATYLLSYAASGEEPFQEDDVRQFAMANGAYHSWPFVRELLYSLTARMGYPPYTLPVLIFVPPQRSPKPKNPSAPEKPAAQP